MPHPIISLPWNTLNSMAYSLNDEYVGVAVDFYRAAMMKMMLESIALVEAPIEQLLGRPYGLQSCTSRATLELPFTDDELSLLALAGHDLMIMSADDVGRLFERVYDELGYLELDVGIDGALPKSLTQGNLKAIRSNEWGSFLITHALDEETGVWMACPPSPFV